ncbi:MAG TPA: hypothetical protein VGK67_13105 [Myxococcales bacterium]|jgi:hypothetical protein
MTKLKTQLSRLAAHLRSEEGQGMTEYASISSILVIGVILGVGGTPVFQGFMKAYQDYMTSIFYVLTIAFP